MRGATYADKHIITAVPVHTSVTARPAVVCFAASLNDRLDMKQKMSTADVAGEVACLRTRVIGMRVMNVYDINAKVCCEH